jgi:outer membrane protein
MSARRSLRFVAMPSVCPTTTTSARRPRGSGFARRVRGLALALPLLAGGPALGAPTVARAEVPALRKVAMVDMQRVLNETSAGKKARASLEKSSKAKQSTLDAKRKKLESDYSKLMANPPQGEAARKAEEDLQRQSMELQQMLYTLQNDLQEQEQKLLETMYGNCQTIVTDMAREQQLDLVLVRDQMTVIYTKDAYDITAAVIKAYDAKHK